MLARAAAFDVIVVGGGHAGCEAAAAAARTGAHTLLLTQRLDTIGELSCNPSIGGVGKGQLVREVDALDGLIGKVGQLALMCSIFIEPVYLADMMRFLHAWVSLACVSAIACACVASVDGQVADAAAIQYRMLNQSKGPAVRGPRAQMDRVLYRHHMQAELKSVPGLILQAGSVEDLLLQPANRTSTATVKHGAGNRSEPAVRGVRLSCGQELVADQVVLTTGTFLRGLIHRGRETTPAGRAGDAPSVGLALTLERLGFPLGRLKTGTPPRLDGRTIDWKQCLRQAGDDPPSPFSFLSSPAKLPCCQIDGGQADTWSIRTSQSSQAVVAKAVAAGLAPWFQEEVVADAAGDPAVNGSRKRGPGPAPKGPRYCMAIETKVARFPDRTHNVWLEPEGWETDVVYPAGLSTGLPGDVQREFLRLIPGLEMVEIVADGYCIEYDFIDPRQLAPSLESSLLPGLWLAGQINGTTGYEEAAAQGLMAGGNAGLSATGRPPLILDRGEAYIGVLIDDLSRSSTAGIWEPYRMFTSRAEFRMSLRPDNADIRLTKRGHEAGLVADRKRLEAAMQRTEIVDNAVEKLGVTCLKPAQWRQLGVDMAEGDGSPRSIALVLGSERIRLHDIVGRVTKLNPDNKLDRLLDGDLSTENCSPLNGVTAETIEAELIYARYLERQTKDAASLRQDEKVTLHPSLWPCHDSVWARALKIEVREKLDCTRPPTLGAASRIVGMTPAALVSLRLATLRAHSEARESTVTCNIGPEILH